MNGPFIKCEDQFLDPKPLYNKDLYQTETGLPGGDRRMGGSLALRDFFDMFEKFSLMQSIINITYVMFVSDRCSYFNQINFIFDLGK